MEHDPSREKKDRSKQIDAHRTDPAGEVSEPVERMDETDMVHDAQPDIVDVSIDAEELPEVPSSIPALASNAQDFADFTRKTDVGDSSAVTPNGLEMDRANVSTTDFDGSVIDEAMINDSFTADSGSLPAAAPIAPPIDDLIGRPCQRGFIQQLPYFPRQNSDSATIRLLGETSDAPTAGGASPSSSELDSLTQALLGPTSDGGPPLARLIVLVSLENTQFRKIIDESLATTSERDAKTCKECAQEAVDYARWRDHCELRALTGDY